MLCDTFLLITFDCIALEKWGGCQNAPLIYIDTYIDTPVYMQRDLLFYLEI